MKSKSFEHIIIDTPSILPWSSPGSAVARREIATIYHGKKAVYEGDDTKNDKDNENDDGNKEEEEEDDDDVVVY